MRRILLMLALVLSVRATAQAATFTDTIYFSFNSTNVYTATVPNDRIWAIASDPGVISFLTGEDDWIVYAHYVNLPIGSTVTDARIILTLRQNDDEREGTLVPSRREVILSPLGPSHQLPVAATITRLRPAPPTSPPPPDIIR